MVLHDLQKTVLHCVKLVCFLTLLLTSEVGCNTDPNTVEEFVSSTIINVPVERITVSSENSDLSNVEGSVATTITVPTENGSNLVISTEDIIDCTRTGATLRYTITSAEIFYFSEGIDDGYPVRGDCSLELVVPEGMVLKFQVIDLRGRCTFGAFFVEVTDVERDDIIFEEHGMFGFSDVPVLSFGNMVEVLVGTSTGRECVFRMNFTAVDESEIPRIELNFTSPTAGFVQTPGWDKRSTYPHNMDSWVQVDVPEAHKAMITMQHIDVESSRATCWNDFVELYVGGDTTADMVWRACRGYRPSTAVYDTSVFHVHFVSSDDRAFAGFRLLFSFHNHYSVPQRLENGLWNCSVPHWTDFQDHFLCDLDPDCVTFKDEENCSYTTDSCGLGKVTLGGRCYMFTFLEDDAIVTWDDASNQCLLRGGHLISLNTPEEWRELSPLLQRTGLDFFIGLRKANPVLPLLYQNTWQWSDKTVAYHMSHFTSEYALSECGYFRPDYYGLYNDMVTLVIQPCDIRLLQQQTHILCEVNSESSLATSPLPSAEPSGIQLAEITEWSANVSQVQCPAGHMTHTFLACDAQSSCWGRAEGSHDSCTAPVAPLPPMMTCADGVEQVPLTLVCDHREDCRDGSDETFCTYPPCDLTVQMKCGNVQCVLKEERCNGVERCVNGADEVRCTLYDDRFTVQFISTIPPPAIIDFDHRGNFSVRLLNASQCPETHFQCPGGGYCLPVYVRCNGVYDCPGHEDEAGCDSYTCPGFYRCRGSRVCLHSRHLCDGIAHCPQQDDELLCKLYCPSSCTCLGLAFFCPQPLQSRDWPQLRFLHARGTGMTLSDVSSNTMLIELILAECGLWRLEPVSLPNLRALDLSDNNITAVSTDLLARLPSLQSLSLARNPLTALFPSSDAAVELTSVTSLQLSGVLMAELDVRSLAVFPNLELLNLSQCGIDTVLEPGFQPLQHLRQLDVRGCPLSQFPRDVLAGLSELEAVDADNYKLCCPATLPAGFNMAECRAPTDEISSCEALLRADVYRVLLAVSATLAIVGNLLSLLYRVFFNRHKSKLAFGVFVTHLCVSDLLMGVYLAVIGVADRLYQGSYLWKDLEWRKSAACQMAGFLALLSSEVSAFIICLITLDRFLVLRFPFSQLRFTPMSAHLVCLLLWAVGLMLAAVPLLPVTSHWLFYSQTGICIPLPISRKSWAGSDYSFGVLIVVNLLVFLLIAIGQAFIFWSIRSNSMAPQNSSNKSKDLTIARRLFTVVLSDFLCWFPIGLLGLLAAQNVAIPGQVSVAMAIVVLPLNSALNPFLYTVNMLLERRRHKAEQMMEKRVLMKLKDSSTGISNVTST